MFSFRIVTTFTDSRIERVTRALLLIEYRTTMTVRYLYVFIPQFSMAPAAKSGIASKSNFGNW